MLRCILLMSRPPLLCEEGNVLSHELVKLKLSHYPKFIHIFIDRPNSRAPEGFFESRFPTCRRSKVPYRVDHTGATTFARLAEGHSLWRNHSSFPVAAPRFRTSHCPPIP